MIGLWLEDGKLRLETTLPDPTPAADEALVRVVQAGICNRSQADAWLLAAFDHSKRRGTLKVLLQIS